MKFKIIKRKPAPPPVETRRPKLVFPKGNVADRHLQKTRTGVNNDPAGFCGNRVLEGLQSIASETESMLVFNTLTNKAEVLPIIRITHLATLLGMSYQTVWRWTGSTKQLPNPVLHEPHGRKLGVYHPEEVRVILTVIGNHLNRFRRYQKNHDETIQKVNDEVDTIRNKYLTGEHQHGNQAQRKTASRKGRIVASPRKRILG